MARELERTFLARQIPGDLLKSRIADIEDYYIPALTGQPRLRARRVNGAYELTKKTPLSDASVHLEETLQLDAREFETIRKCAVGPVTKRRYRIDRDGREFQIDVFDDQLKGLVLVEVEFADESDMASFVPPADLCRADVTTEDFIAGGRLAGMSLADIGAQLSRFGYEPLSLVAPRR
jgi:CYTH domain-containing protein